MIYIDTGNYKVQELSFYLAMEEYIAREKPREKDCFFMWQVAPSVIIGRNQVAQNEINIDYCLEHGIKIYRRKSGGGCVYADYDNVMLSYITPSGNVSETFSRYLNMVAETLNEFGICAKPNDHNDIMIGSRKVSGNAIYHLKDCIIAHGTLLYNTNMEHMIHAITPSKQKLIRHGVESVRQRICLLKDFTALPLEIICKRIREHLCDSTLTMTNEDVKAIQMIEREYKDPKFIGI